MPAPSRILIVGGGIAGLALGRALREQGFVPEIIERAVSWRGRSDAGRGPRAHLRSSTATFELSQSGALSTSGSPNSERAKAVPSLVGSSVTVAFTNVLRGVPSDQPTYARFAHEYRRVERAVR
jgi:cation diffusion facilitator CzcD-associated flavoprotein CzcO